jgi:glycerol kinase
MSKFLLSIDQGTTSTRAIVFNDAGQPVSWHQLELQQYFPNPGWVEHDAEEIWQATVACCQQALQNAGLSAKDIEAIGITNQRETTVIWDRTTGVPIHRAIVWQDRRTTDFCQALFDAGHEPEVQYNTGLLLDPYFSASKITWLLDHVPGARAQAEKGSLAFGTIDSFLLWRLTHGARHATDVTNASRTQLFNIHTLQWDDSLLRLFNVPSSLLPEVLDNTADFGATHPSLFGHAIPIAAMAGDQQAALIGQACFQPGMVKSTYGTGAFLIVNTGVDAVISKNRLLTTIGYRIRGVTHYAIEGSIFSSGSTVQWLRDKLRLIENADQTESLAASLPDNGGVYLIPAFTGLGAPYWKPGARASIEGLTRDSQPAHIVRAALEAVAYQTRDLLNAVLADSPMTLGAIRVDGGMVVNNWLMQFLADMLHLPVERPGIKETTALGVAFLAGLQVGVFKSLEEISELWRCERRFEPEMDAEVSQGLYQSWQQTINRVLAL